MVTKKRNYIDEFENLLLLQNHWVNFDQTWHKASLGGADFSLFKWRATPFSRIDYNELARKWCHHLKILKIKNRRSYFFSLNQRYGIITALQKCVYWLELCIRLAMWPMGLLLKIIFSRFIIFHTAVLSIIELDVSKCYHLPNHWKSKSYYGYQDLDRKYPYK